MLAHRGAVGDPKRASRAPRPAGGAGMSLAGSRVAGAGLPRRNCASSSCIKTLCRARHPYFAETPDLVNAGGVDYTDPTFRALKPGQQLLEIARRGIKLNGHQPRWCTSCQYGQVRRGSLFATRAAQDNCRAGKPPLPLTRRECFGALIARAKDSCRRPLEAPAGPSLSAWHAAAPASARAPCRAPNAPSRRRICGIRIRPARRGP